MIRTIYLVSLVGVTALLSSCDDESNASPSGGGPGYSDVQATSNGFCDPQGGLTQMGSAAYADSSVAKIDSDGDPSANGHDANWQPGTTGHVNGGYVDSSQYNYVVMSRQQMSDSGVSIGDWAQVTNNATGQSAWARVEDVGPAGGSGEISESAAHSVGIQYTDNRFTVGNPSVSVAAYANTSSVPSECNNL